MLLLLTASALCAPAIADVAPGPILNWTMDEATGNTLGDSSGNGNNGSLINGPARAFGVSGNDLAFDGVGDYATLSKVGALIGGNSAHSISAWINVSALPAKRAWILLLGNAGPGAHHWLLNGDGTTQFGAWNGNVLKPVLGVGQWTHVAMTYASGTLSAYVNGGLIGTVSATFNVLGAPLTLAKPGIATENTFNGQLDEVEIYNYALSTAQIAALAAVPPNVHTVLPNSGPIGTSMAIRGSGFGQNGSGASISFGGVLATVSPLSSETTLYTNVPDGAGTGDITVTVGGRTSVNRGYFSVTSMCPRYSVTTFAGVTGNIGTADGVGSAARFTYPQGIALDGSGNFFVVDNTSYTVRKITPSGAVTTYAGTPGEQGSEGGLMPVSASYGLLQGLGFGMATDPAGNVFVTEAYNLVTADIRKISPDGLMSYFAGTPYGFTGNTDGTGAAATFYFPSGLATDVNGNVFVTDFATSTIRKITPAAVVTTFAGTPYTYGTVDGIGSAARFTAPLAIASDRDGNLYVGDQGAIRKITPAGAVSTIAKTASGMKETFDGPTGNAGIGAVQSVAVDFAGNIYFNESTAVIRKITPDGQVTTIAGTQGGYYPAVDGIGVAARFGSYTGLAVDASGTVFATDAYNATLRKLSPIASCGPFINYFEPVIGGVGTSVSIGGTNLGATPAANTVTFNGVTATVTSSTSTSLTAIVPNGASSGRIKVVVAGQSAVSDGPFTVAVPPDVAMIAPASGTVGTLLTVTGSNFSTTPGNNFVAFGSGAQSDSLTASTTQLSMYVPPGAGTGQVGIGQRYADGGTYFGATHTNFTVIPSRLLLNWPLDQSTGTSVNDASGNGNGGTLINGASWTTGRFGNALGFDGIDDYAAVAAVAALPAGNVPHSITAWVKVSALPVSREWILLLGNAGPGAHHWLLNSNGSTQFGAWNGPTLAPALAVGQWTHVAITYGNGVLSAYVNGNLAGSKAASFNLQGAPLTLAKPGLAAERYFNGLLDEVHVYNYALSAAEIGTLATSGAPSAVAELAPLPTRP